MKNYLLLLLGVLFTLNLNGQILDIQDIEIVKEYESGNEISQFGIRVLEGFTHDDNEPNYPGSICFDYLGRLNIFDSINSRLVILNNNFKAIESIKIPHRFGYGQVEHFENYIISTSGNYFCSVYKKNEHKSIDVRLLNSLSNNNQDSFIYTGDIVFSKIDDGVNISFINPGDSFSDNIKNVLYEEDTLKLFNDPDINSLKDYSFKDGYILYKGNHIITSFKDYYHYWDNIHKKNNMKEPTMDINVEYSHSRLSRAFFSFIGKDENGLTYWQANRSVFIFDEKGWLYHIVKLSRKIKQTTSWRLSPDGNLYAFNTIYDEKKHQLLRIKKQW